MIVLCLRTSDTIIREYQQALQSLHQYHIFKGVRMNSTDAYSLTPNFATPLRQALVGADESRSFGEIISASPKESVSIAELDRYAEKQWENILSYIVGSTAAVESANPGSPPSQGIIELLEVGDFIALPGSDSRGSYPDITQAGFSFVLQDVDTQLWALIFSYVRNAAAQGLDEVDVLSFVFLISSLQPGLAFSSANLNQTQRRVLLILSALGIVYQPNISDNGPTAYYYYPTRLATTLASDISTATSTIDTTLGLSLSHPLEPTQPAALSSSKPTIESTPTPPRPSKPPFFPSPPRSAAATQTWSRVKSHDSPPNVPCNAVFLLSRSSRI